MQAIVIHDHNYELHLFHLDLRSPAPPLILKKCGRTPARVGQSARCNASAMFAARMKPPLIMFGTTAMHFAPENTSSGMPLSGVAMMCCSVFAELSRRPTTSVLVWSAQHDPAIDSTRMDVSIGKRHRFILTPSPSAEGFDSATRVTEIFTRELARCGFRSCPSWRNKRGTSG